MLASGATSWGAWDVPAAKLSPPVRPPRYAEGPPQLSFAIFGKPEPAVFEKDFFVIHGSLCLAVAFYCGSLDMLTCSSRLRSANACLTSCSRPWSLSESI